MNLATTVSAPQVGGADYFTGERYKALRLLWRRTSLKSVRSCQHHSVMPDGMVKAMITPSPTGPITGFSGLATCGSVWSCPVCSYKIATRRAQDIAQVIRVWEALGGRVAMVTLTMRHKRGQRLEELWAALSKAWQSVTMGDWSDDQELYGTPIPRRITHGARKGQLVTENRIPWMRAVEATHGVNGWHLHIHSLLFLKGNPDLDGLSKSMFQRWRTRLVGVGLSAPIASRGGLDARWIVAGDDSHIDEYVTKGTYDGALRAGFEAAAGGQKKAGGKAPFQMLANVCDNLDNADSPTLQKVAEADLARWWEWEQASKGRYQITWSRGFRDFLALEDEMTDEEIAAEDGTTDQTVINAYYVNSEWAVIRRDIPAEKRRMLDWFADEYLPTLDLVPNWARQWQESFFVERRERLSRRDPAENRRHLTVVKRVSDTGNVLDADRCSGCGEVLAVELRSSTNGWRHLGC
jgi:hypothetical protein